MDGHLNYAKYEKMLRNKIVDLKKICKGPRTKYMGKIEEIFQMELV